MNRFQEIQEGTSHGETTYPQHQHFSSSNAKTKIDSHLHPSQTSTESKTRNRRLGVTNESYTSLHPRGAELHSDMFDITETTIDDIGHTPKPSRHQEPKKALVLPYLGSPKRTPSSGAAANFVSASLNTQPRRIQGDDQEARSPPVEDNGKRSRMDQRPLPVPSYTTPPRNSRKGRSPPPPSISPAVLIASPRHNKTSPITVPSPSSRIKISPKHMTPPSSAYPSEPKMKQQRDSFYKHSSTPSRLYETSKGSNSTIRNQLCVPELQHDSIRQSTTSPMHDHWRHHTWTRSEEAPTADYSEGRHQQQQQHHRRHHHTRTRSEEDPTTHLIGGTRQLPSLQPPSRRNISPQRPREDDDQLGASYPTKLQVQSQRNSDDAAPSLQSPALKENTNAEFASRENMLVSKTGTSDTSISNSISRTKEIYGQSVASSHAAIAGIGTCNSEEDSEVGKGNECSEFNTNRRLNPPKDPPSPLVQRISSKKLPHSLVLQNKRVLDEPRISAKSSSNIQEANKNINASETQIHSSRDISIRTSMMASTDEDGAIRPMILAPRFSVLRAGAVASTISPDVFQPSPIDHQQYAPVDRQDRLRQSEEEQCKAFDESNCPAMDTSKPPQISASFSDRQGRGPGQAIELSPQPQRPTIHTDASAPAQVSTPTTDRHARLIKKDFDQNRLTGRGNEPAIRVWTPRKNVTARTYRRRQKEADRGNVGAAVPGAAHNTTSGASGDDGPTFDVSISPAMETPRRDRLERRRRKEAAEGNNFVETANTGMQESLGIIHRERRLQKEVEQGNLGAMALSDASATMPPSPIMAETSIRNLNFLRGGSFDEGYSQPLNFHTRPLHTDDDSSDSVFSGDDEDLIPGAFNISNGEIEYRQNKGVLTESQRFSSLGEGSRQTGGNSLAYSMKSDEKTSIDGSSRARGGRTAVERPGPGRDIPTPLDEEAPQHENLNSNKCTSNRSSNFLKLAVLSLLICVGVVVGTILALRDKDPPTPQPQSPRPTNAPTVTPTMTPTLSEQAMQFIDILDSVSEESSFVGLNKPHAMALVWIADIDDARLNPFDPNLDTEILIERYVMALIYLSMMGSQISVPGFLSAGAVCGWNDARDIGIFCTGGRVTNIQLSKSTSLIPSCFRVPSDVLIFSCGNNVGQQQLAGSIPSEIFALRSLETLNLGKLSSFNSLPVSLSMHTPLF